MHTISRRHFLKAGAALAAGAASGFLPGLAFAAPGAYRGDVLVNVFLRGGADCLNLVVPYTEPAYYANRPTIAIAAPGSATGTALDLDGFFGLHPSAAPLRPWFQNKTLAIVHAAGSTDPSRSHFDQQDYIEFGRPGFKYNDGWVGRNLQTLGLPADIFTGVGMGSRVQKSLMGTIPPLGVSSIGSFRMPGGDALKPVMQTLYAGSGVLAQTASQTFAALTTMERLRLAGYAPANGAIYPANGFGRQMANVAQMIKEDVGLAAACVDLGGWDTHDNEGGASGTFATNVATLANTLNALATDMGSSMGQITVVVMTEFGRRLKESASLGTDHGRGGAMLVLGGGILGGKVYGQWPGLADSALDHGDLAVTTDFRTVLGEIVLKRLGNPALDQVFPGFTLQPLGLAVG